MPTFAPNQRLARYIRPEYRQRTRRAKPPAFMQDPETTNDGLSVNTLEVHTDNQIAAIYREKFKAELADGAIPVAMSTPRVEDYNIAAEGVGMAIAGHYPQEPHWTNPGPDGHDEPSYVLNDKPKNESHCLVRFTRLLDEAAEFRFAVRMARTPTYREF